MGLPLQIEHKNHSFFVRVKQPASLGGTSYFPGKALAGCALVNQPSVLRRNLVAFIDTSGVRVYTLLTTLTNNSKKNEAIP